MRRQLALRIILTSSFIALLGACAMFQRPMPPTLVGTWTNSLGTVWMIKADGTFDADLDGDSKRDGWGSWKVSGDMVTLRRSGGIKPKGCDGKGVYHFTRSGDTLHFTLVSDSCRLRRKNVLLGWQRK